MVPNVDFLSDADGDNDKDNNKDKNNHNMYGIFFIFFYNNIQKVIVLF